jgi:hypothetical protein
MIIRPRRGEAQVAAAYSQPSVYDVHRQFDLGSGDAARQSIEGDRRYIRSWTPGTAGAGDIIASHGLWAHAKQRRDSSSEAELRQDQPCRRALGKQARSGWPR